MSPLSEGFHHFDHALRYVRLTRVSVAGNRARVSLHSLFDDQRREKTRERERGRERAHVSYLTIFNLARAGGSRARESSRTLRALDFSFPFSCALAHATRLPLL
jgi:hypothetical protein